MPVVSSTKISKNYPTASHKVPGNVLTYINRGALACPKGSKIKVNLRSSTKTGRMSKNLMMRLPHKNSS